MTATRQFSTEIADSLYEEGGNSTRSAKMT